MDANETAAPAALAHIDCIAALTACLSFADFRSGRAPRVANLACSMRCVREAAEVAKARGLVEYAGDESALLIKPAWHCAVRLTAEGLRVVTSYHTDIID